VDVRAQGILCEAGFPQPRRELGDLGRRMLADTLQHIDEVGVGIDLVQPAGNDQALDDADELRLCKLIKVTS